MASLIQIDEQKCSLNLTCVRVCPAKAIKVNENHAAIVPGRCIGCGHCVTVCGVHAISFRVDSDVVTQLLQSGQKVAAICDPSIAGEFSDISDYRKYVAMIRALGFDYVLETSFGVELVAFKYKELMDNSKGKYYLTTNCPPVISYVEKYHPQLIDNLAPIVPPHTAMAKVVHQMYGDDVKIVLLTSCLAAKDDVKRFHHTDGYIDSVLSFVKLRELLKAKGITETSVEFSEFDPPVGRKGGLFAMGGGLMQSIDINSDMLSSSIESTEGRNHFIHTIAEFETNPDLNQHFDIYYCEGCIMGPGTTPQGRREQRRSEVIKYVRKRAKQTNRVSWEDDIQRFLNLDFSRKFVLQDKRLPIPAEEEVLNVFHQMGKKESKDILDCGACGYLSCHDFAVAYTQGLTHFDMCVPQTVHRQHNLIDSLNETNKRLENMQQALRASEEKAKIGEISARESSEVVSTMLQKLRAGVVIVDAQLKIIESNSTFVQLMGEEAIELNEVIYGLKGADLASIASFHRLFSTVLETGNEVMNRDVAWGDGVLNISVFTIKKNQIVGGIIRDLATPEVQKEEVIARARAVIKENLQTVQQIAFLLGESASKTEKTLNSIIEAQQINSKH